MTTCVNCEKREAKLYGSAHYLRRDLCLGCYYDYYQAKTRAEDRLKDATKAAEAAQAPPHAAKAGEPGSTPTWRAGRNVAVREKTCDRCGALISIRKNQTGRHYPADRGHVRPHRCPEVTP